MNEFRIAPVQSSAIQASPLRTTSDGAVQRVVVLMGPIRKHCSTRGAVRFAQEVLRRIQAPGNGQIALNETVECVQILVDTANVLASGAAYRPGQARFLGIDEDEVGTVEQRVWLVRQDIGGSWSERRLAVLTRFGPIESMSRNRLPVPGRRRTGM
ncbi:hypothetical protein [Caballeronia arvi]|uniref:hypothetical protein n=1 Tax=Caballeronia arvi TaxID=1777135 RepID=UPI00117EB493|nr:hypothetical protein [Caballeronia arvi]